MSFGTLLKKFIRNASLKSKAKRASIAGSNWRHKYIEKEDRPFRDKISVVVKGGTGGNGLARLGGIGGCGGNVFLQCSSESKFSSLDSPIRISAAHGQSSSRLKVRGEDGEDTYFKVPRGTCLVHTRTKETLCDLNSDGDLIQVARGGTGGSPESNWQGSKGTRGSFLLLLKLIADVGFVGFPNAGKSTLLRGLSRAKPAVTAFPFTTVQPNIGILKFNDLRSISLADLPGLIEGAHQNVGLGHQFLRHVERTHMLMYIVDVNGFRLTHNHIFRSGLDTLLLLFKELELYDPCLLSKPSLLVLNKVEDNSSQELADKIEVDLKSRHVPEHMKEFEPKIYPNFLRIHHVSALQKTGLDTLSDEIRKQLDNIALSNEVDSDVSRSSNLIRVDITELRNRILRDK